MFTFLMNGSIAKHIRPQVTLDELDASHHTKRRFVTGWFSPEDCEIVVMYYERGSPIHFQAEVLRCGELVTRFQDENLARLQSDVSIRFGGEIHSSKYEARGSLPQCVPRTST